MARKKSTTIAAPTTLAEALALMTQYAGLMASIERIELDAVEAIAQIEGARDKFAKPVEEAMKDLFLRLRAWWAVAGSEITGDKRKSAALAGLLIGIRTTTPALKLPKGEKAEDLAKALFEDGEFKRFVKAKLTLNKPLIISAIRGAPDNHDGAAFLLSGYRTDQREEFFIDRAAPSPADPEIITPEGE